jgi:hypothetical protein
MRSSFFGPTGFSTPQEAIEAALSNIAAGAEEPLSATEFSPAESTPPVTTYRAGDFDQMTVVENNGQFFVTQSLVCARSGG